MKTSVFSEGFSRKIPALRQRNTDGDSASSENSPGVLTQVEGPFWVNEF
jgi:hypothetical protein